MNICRTPGAYLLICWCTRAVGLKIEIHLKLRNAVPINRNPSSVGTVENHGKKWQKKTRHTFVKRQRLWLRLGVNVEDQLWLRLNPIPIRNCNPNPTGWLEDLTALLQTPYSWLEAGSGYGKRKRERRGWGGIGEGSWNSAADWLRPALFIDCIMVFGPMIWCRVFAVNFAIFTTQCLRLRLGVAISWFLCLRTSRYWPAGSQQAGAVHRGPGR